MKVNELDNITGTLSKPSKMPGWAYGIPAKECKVGSKLAKFQALSVMVVTLLKVVTYSQMYKQHNTNV